MGTIETTTFRPAAILIQAGRAENVLPRAELRRRGPWSAMCDVSGAGEADFWFWHAFLPLLFGPSTGKADRRELMREDLRRRVR